MSPPEIDKLDAALRQSVHRGRWAAVGVLALIVAAAITVFSWIIVQQRNQLEASCQFYRDLATVQLPAKPAPTRLTVDFQVHAREAYSGEGCGRLPAPYPVLRREAARYHIRIPG